MSDDARPTGRDTSHRAVVAVLTVAGMCAVLMNALLIPIIPDLPRLLDTSFERATWVVTTTLIAGAVFTPIIGRLGDVVGKRRVYVGSLGVLAVGALVAALSTSLVPLLIGRTLQGAGVGVIPVGISILRQTLPPDRLPTAVAMVSASLGVGASIGLPLSAVVIALVDWHAVFWIATFLACGLIVLALAVVPRDRGGTDGRVDVAGAVALAACLVPALLVVTQGRTWGWLSARTFGCVVLASVAAAGWTWHELRAREPLVDLRLATRPGVLLTNVTSFALGFAMFGSNVIFPQVLRAPVETGTGFGMPLVQAGLCLAPLGLVMMLFSPVGARLSTRHGPGLSLVLGTAAVSVAYLLAAFWRTEPWQSILAIVLVGIGVGLGYAAMPTLIMRATPAAATTSANALNALMRSLGTSCASAVVGSVLASRTVSIGAGEWPLPGAVTTAFLVVAGAALVATLVALTIPRREVAGRADSPTTDGPHAQVRVVPHTGG